MSNPTSFKHNDAIQFLHGFMQTRDWELGSKMLNHIVERCDKDTALAKHFDDWVKVAPLSVDNDFEPAGGTAHLRDKLATPFKDEFKNDLDFFNAWAAMDASYMYLRLEAHSNPNVEIDKFPEINSKQSKTELDNFIDQNSIDVKAMVQR